MIAPDSHEWLHEMAAQLRVVTDSSAGDAHWLLSRCELLLAADNPASDVGFLGELALSLADYAREHPTTLREELLAAMPVVGEKAFYIHLLHLEAFVRRVDGAPRWTRVLVSSKPLVALGELAVVERGFLREPVAYESDFAVLLSRGYAWINLHAAGILRGALLVEVETPGLGHRGEATSVNLSAPSKHIVERPGWMLDEYVRIVEKTN